MVSRSTRALVKNDGVRHTLRPSPVPETPWWRVAAAFALALSAACGDDSVAPERPLLLAMISGDHQPGTAGFDLPEPFVARVTDWRGRGVQDTTVIWTVESGEGTFGGRFEMAGCPPLGTALVRTDADGFARVSFMPTWFGLSTVQATVRGATPLTFTTDASDPGAVLTMVEGNYQQGTSGDPLPHALSVKVTDGNGQAVPNVSVSWASVPGRGTLLDGCPWTASWDQAIVTGRTGSDGQATGVATMTFRPRDFDVGITTISAALRGTAPTPVTFTVDITTMVVPLAHDPWFDTVGFRGPRIAPFFTAPLGATIEFRNNVPATRMSYARIMSTSIPPGGEAFDSGELTPGRRFTFVPRVMGTWHFIDQVSGVRGELTVH